MANDDLITFDVGELIGRFCLGKACNIQACNIHGIISMSWAFLHCGNNQMSHSYLSWRYCMDIPSYNTYVLNLVTFSSSLVNSKLWTEVQSHAGLFTLVVVAQFMMRATVSSCAGSRSSSVQRLAMLHTVGLKICALPAAGQRHAACNEQQQRSLSPLSVCRLRAAAVIGYSVL